MGSFRENFTIVVQYRRASPINLFIQLKKTKIQISKFFRACRRNVYFEDSHFGKFVHIWNVYSRKNVKFDQSFQEHIFLSTYFNDE